MATSRTRREGAQTIECDPSMNDDDIIAAYREGRDGSCFRLLYDRYAGRIYSKAMTMLHRRDEAEDATQEIFTKVFLNLNNFEGQSKFSTWVYSITYNMCIDRLRRRRRGVELFTSAEIYPAAADTIDVEEMSEEELTRLQLNELRRVLRKLSEAERTLLLMKYKDGLKIKDIAALFGKSESAVKMQLKRAREKAKRIHNSFTPSSTPLTTP